MEKLCCILDADESYAIRLSDCFNSRRALPYPVRAFSDAEAYRQCAQENEVELLLVGDSMYPAVQENTAGRVIRLCESPSGKEESCDLGIAKYQASDNVIRDVMNIYGDVRPSLRQGLAEHKARIVCIYSPNGYSGKTTLGLALSHIKGQKERVLYLSLEEFSAVMSELPDRRGNLSDALFYYQAADGRATGKLLSVIGQAGSFDYIPPAACAKDLPHFSSEAITEFVCRIAQAGDYGIVVVDVGSLIKEPWELLCRADVVLSPKPDSAHRRRRQMEFEKYLHQIGRKEVAERITLVDIIRDDNIAREGKINYPRLMGSAYGRMVSAIDV